MDGWLWFKVYSPMFQNKLFPESLAAVQEWHNVSNPGVKHWQVPTRWIKVRPTIG